MPEWGLILYVLILLLITFGLGCLFGSKGYLRIKSAGKKNIEKTKLIKEILSTISEISSKLEIQSSNAAYNEKNQLINDLKNAVKDLENIKKWIIFQTDPKKDSNDTDKTELSTDDQSSLNAENAADKPGRFFSDDSVTNSMDHEEKPYPVINVSNRDPVAKFVEIYNQASENRTQRHLFWEHYTNWQRFGNKNAYAQARGENVDYDFQNEDNGDFIAVKIDSLDKYLVVPNFGTTITETSYKEGGFEKIFDCRNYQSGTSYSGSKVIKPAKFTKQNEKWTLIKQGQIYLH